MIAITGHSDGIGKALFEKYAPNAIGFSRSNGYDISDRDSLDKILAAAVDCDVFVNNAHCDYAQVELLYAFSKARENTNKFIVNISSNSSDGIKQMPHPYAVQKSALDKASEQLSRHGNACRILNLRPGYIDTNRVKHVTDTKLRVESVVSIINWILHQPSDMSIVSLTVLPRDA